MEIRTPSFDGRIELEDGDVVIEDEEGRRSDLTRDEFCHMVDTLEDADSDPISAVPDWRTIYKSDDFYEHVALSGDMTALLSDLNDVWFSEDTGVVGLDTLISVRDILSGGDERVEDDVLSNV